MKGLIWLSLLAYVMPASSVLRRTAASRDDLELTSLKVEAHFQVSAAAAPAFSRALGVGFGQGEMSLTAVVSMRMPSRCRIEVSSAESTKTVVVISNNGRRKVESKDIPALSLAVDEICALLALRGSTDGDSRAALEKHLGNLKVDSRQISLARYDGALAYLIGQTSAGASQFWVYKTDRFQPGRIRFTDSLGRWDMKFRDYASQANDGFPRVFEVWKDDVLQFRMTTLNADSKARIEDNLF